MDVVVFKNILYLFLLMASFLGASKAHGVTCPPVDYNRVYTESELSILNGLTNVGKVALSKSIPPRESTFVNYEALNITQKTLLNSVVGDDANALLDAMKGNVDVDFMVEGASLYGLCNENSSKDCAPLLLRGLSRHHIFLSALASAWEYVDAAEYRGWTIGSVGQSPQNWAPIFIRSLEQFKGDAQVSKRLVEILKTADLKDHPDHRQNSASLLKHYRTNQPILLKTGYLGHSVSAILYKDYLIIGNRGENHHPNYPSVIYTINTRKVTAGIISLIQDLDWLPPDNFISFQSALSQILDAVPNSMSDTVAEIYRGDEWQKVGNCSWASLEAAIISLWTVMSAEQSKDLSHSIDHIRKWREFTKLYLLKEYITSYSADMDGLCPTQLGMLLAKSKDSSGAHLFPELSLEIEARGQRLLTQVMYVYANPDCITLKGSLKTPPVKKMIPHLKAQTTPTKAKDTPTVAVTTPKTTPSSTQASVKPSTKPTSKKNNKSVGGGQSAPKSEQLVNDVLSQTQPELDVDHAKSSSGDHLSYLCNLFLQRGQELFGVEFASYLELLKQELPILREKKSSQKFLGNSLMDLKEKSTALKPFSKRPLLNTWEATAYMERLRAKPPRPTYNTFSSSPRPSQLSFTQIEP